MLRPALALACAMLLAAPALADRPGLTLRGDARMGLAWSSQPDWAGQRETGLRTTSRARLHIEYRGQTDGGLHFGANITLDPDRNRDPAGRHEVWIGE